MKTERKLEKKNDRLGFCFLAPVIPDKIDSPTSWDLPLASFFPLSTPPLHTCPENEWSTHYTWVPLTSTYMSDCQSSGTSQTTQDRWRQRLKKGKWMWERQTIRADNEGKDSKVNFKESKDDYSKTVEGAGMLSGQKKTEIRSSVREYSRWVGLIKCRQRKNKKFTVNHKKFSELVRRRS